MGDTYTFYGDYLIYQGKKIGLNKRTILLDGGMDADMTDKYAHVYQSLREAMEAVNALGEEKGCVKETEAANKEKITVLIAPGVYWLHDPGAEDVAVPEPGHDEPYGLTIACDALRLTGLSEHRNEVVLAGNRGQSHGARGNYTLFLFRVRDLELSNLTMGNYCNVDLDYSPCPGLSRKKRTSVITQAQLAKQWGDRVLAQNCDFVSRLNLCPVCGGERCLYVRCHFECTDDSLNGRGVYVECDFDFYGSRPLYDTRGSGAVFLGCRFRIGGDGGERKQYFTKENGPVTVVDSEFQWEEGRTRDANDRIAWTKYPLPGLRCYQYKIKRGNFPKSSWKTELSQLTGEKETEALSGSGQDKTGVKGGGEGIVIGGEDMPQTVSMEGKGVLEGYRLVTEEGILYNTFNLLRGMDDWDPLKVKEYAIKAGKSRIPTLLRLEAEGLPGTDNREGREGEIVSGEPGIILRARVFYFSGEEDRGRKVSYLVREQDKRYVILTEYGDGRCLVEGRNEEASERKVCILAVTPEGLEGAAELTVWPKKKEAPEFAEEPEFIQDEKGIVRVSYRFGDGKCEDNSDISWYCCENEKGVNPILTAVTRGGKPQKEYRLTWGEVGYYLMVCIIPQYRCGKAGRAVTLISKRPVSEEDILEETEDGGWKVLINTEFDSMPTGLQKRVLAGFWTVDAAQPGNMAGERVADCLPSQGSAGARWELDVEEPWKYGSTGNGSIGFGLYQNVQGARLLYTPPEGLYGDMVLCIRADPAKTAGQGFGSAGQYMDLCIKFDTISLTGYGVRIIRTKEAADAVRFILMRYDGGEARMLNGGIVTSCYRTGCEIILKAAGKRLTVHAETVNSKAAKGWGRYEAMVDMEVGIEENSYGGVCIWHTGTTGSGGWQNTTMLHSLKVSVIQTST